ncbi:pyridoxal phosphate-dependent aminotransferase [Halobaculum lipolyticum]|uniref:Aminotransferase n=1 Tax=Halobaculum lipolyticum TaxID=3032001 RepID=A0ABD5WAM7_9EURY|nr:aminotransferase class I/II-fold pyridoxal phosphate-dependent enzyme [Halobaculum sp. DT31]
MFPPLAYLQWIEGRPETAEHDLGSSDLRRLPPADADEPVPSRLAGLAPPADDVGLAERIAREYDVDESRVLPTAGATHAGFLACATAATLARERDSPDDDERDADAASPRALVEKPGYEPLVETPRALNLRVARFRRPDPNAVLEPDRVAAAAADLAGPLAHVTVTNRHNPTGRLTTRATLADAAAVVDDLAGYLLVDEVYAPYTEDDGAGPFGGPTAAGLPSTVAVGSLTKFHGLGGLRVGWLVGPERFVERARQVEQYVPALAAPSVALARRFFAHREELVADARAHCRENHDLLRSFLEERDDLAGHVDAGSPFGYVEHERADGDAVSEAAWDAGVLVVPGRFFGLDEGVRVSLGRDPDDCADALTAFGAVLDDL